MALPEGGVLADDGLEVVDAEVEGCGRAEVGEGAEFAVGGVPRDLPGDGGAGVVEVVVVRAGEVGAVVPGGPLEDVGTVGVLQGVGDVGVVDGAGVGAGGGAGVVAFAHVPGGEDWLDGGGHGQSADGSGSGELVPVRWVDP